MRHKRGNGETVSDEARRVKKLLSCTPYQNFQNTGVSQWLHFPGFSWTPVGSRPPREFFFSAREPYDRLFEAIRKDPRGAHVRGVLIVGAKGSGKSSLLRALGAELIGRLGSRFKVVCIWYLDAASDVRRQILDALLFAYSDTSLEDEINSIDTVDDLASFLQRRGAHDKIMLVSDDDVQGHTTEKRECIYEETKRTKLPHLWLSTLERHSFRIVKTLSPDANDAREPPESMKVFSLDALLLEKDYDGYLCGPCSVLDRMLENHPDRKPEVRALAGLHPMSLALLNKACEEYCTSFLGRELEDNGCIPTALVIGY